MGIVRVVGELSPFVSTKPSPERGGPNAELVGDLLLGPTASEVRPDDSLAQIQGQRLAHSDSG